MMISISWCELRRCVNGRGYHSLRVAIGCHGLDWRVKKQARNNSSQDELQ